MPWALHLQCALASIVGSTLARQMPCCTPQIDEGGPLGQTDEQKKAASQQRITALKIKVRRIEQREADAKRRARNHRLIVSGAIVEDE
jgi:hypothetical protein